MRDARPTNPLGQWPAPSAAAAAADDELSLLTRPGERSKFRNDGRQASMAGVVIVRREVVLGEHSLKASLLLLLLLLIPLPLLCLICFHLMDFERTRKTTTTKW